MRPNRYLFPAPALAACLLVSACDERPADPALPTVDVTWKPVQSFDFDLSTRSIWAASENDIYAGRPSSERFGDVGFVGDPRVYHFDGASWSEVDLPIAKEGGDTQVWGTAADNVYVAVERLYHFNGAGWVQELPDARYVSGVSATSVFAANPFTILHFNGAVWDTLLTTTTRFVRGLFAAQDGSLWVSTSDSLLVWNTSSWKALPRSNLYSDESIAPFSPTSAVALRPSGSFYETRTDILRWQGNEWQVEATVPAGLNTVWANGPSEIYAVGDRGVAYKFDGGQWRPLSRPTSFDLYAVAGTGQGGVVAGGATGKVVAYDGAQWRTLREGKFDDPYIVWAESANRFLAARGNMVFKHDAAPWVETLVPFGTEMLAMGGTSLDDVFATLYSGAILHYDGAAWSLSDSLADAQRDIWVARSGTVYTAGDKSVYRFDGTWQRILESDVQFHSIAGNEQGHLLCAGRRSPPQAVVQYFDGSSWRDLPTTERTVYTTWISPDNELYLAGDGLLLWNGSKFTRLTPARSGVYHEIFAADGKVLALGYDGIAVYDGGIVNLLEAGWIGAASQTRDGTIVAVLPRGIGAWNP